MTKTPILLACGAAVVLAGCGGTGTKTLATPSLSVTMLSATTLSATSLSATTPTATTAATSAAATTRAASSACTAGGPIPSNAATRAIPDVDGDGRADTGFIYLAGDNTPVIGVHTAAGGTFVADFYSASGADTRTVTFATIGTGGPVVALTDDNRESQLFVVQGCLLRPAMNPQGQQYQFDLRDFGGNGDGVTCGTVAGQGAETLVGFHYVRDAAGTETGGETRTAVVLGGTTGTGPVTATNGRSETLTTMPDPAGISCETVTEAADAIGLPAS